MRIFILLIIIFIWQSGLCQQSRLLLVIREGHKTGLIDTSGQVIVPAQYDEIEQNYNSPYFYFHSQSKVAVFDHRKLKVITGFYDQISFVGNGNFIVANDVLKGVIDTSGKEIIPVRYQQILVTPEGRFNAFSSDGVDVFNSSGQLQLSLPSTRAIEYLGYYISGTDDKYGLLNQDGSEMLPPVFDSYIAENRRIELYRADSFYCFIPDRNIMLIRPVDCKVSFIMDQYSLDLLPFYWENCRSDRSWKTIFSDKPIKANLDDKSVFETNLRGYFICRDDKCIIIDSLGNEFTDRSYENIAYLYDRNFLVVRNGLSGLLNLDSGLVMDTRYKNIRFANDSVTGRKWLSVNTDDGWMLFDNRYQQVNKTIFSQLSLYDGRGFVAYISNAGALLLDTIGNPMTDPVYSSILPQSNGFWLVRNNDQAGLLDSRGKILLNVKYNDIVVRSGRVRAYAGSTLEYYTWDGVRLTPEVTYSNYRQLDISGSQFIPITGTGSGNNIVPGPYVWKKDSVLKKFGIWSTFAERYALQPVYDFASYDPASTITLTGIYGDTSYFHLGPMTFYGTMKLGLVQHELCRVIVPNVYCFISHKAFMPQFVNFDRQRVTPGWSSANNVVLAIDTLGNYRTISITGQSYSPDVQYMERLALGRAKSWRFDTSYIAYSSHDTKICNIQNAYNTIKSFLRPADAYTDSILKANQFLSLYSPDADSIMFQKVIGERNDDGLRQIDRNYPLFLTSYYYPDILDNQSPRYLNMRIFQKKKRFTYIDDEGNALTDPEFIKVFPFSEGLALVKQGTRYGYINTQGEWVIEEKYRRAASFSEGKAAVVAKGGRYGYIGTDGEWVIEPAYREALAFSEDLAPVKPASLFGYINTAGKMVIKPQFLRALPFSNGTAVVYRKTGYGLINTKGEFLLRCNYSKISAPDSNRLRTVNKKNRLALIDEQGKRITPFSRSLSEAGMGYYSIKIGDDFQLIRPDGSLVASFPSDRPLQVGDNLVMTVTKGKYYYFDISGQQLHGPYDKASAFNHGKAIVSAHQKTSIIDVGGVEKVVLFSNRMSAAGVFDQNGLAIVRSRASYNLVDTAGRFLYTGNEKPIYTGGDIYILEAEGSYLFNYKTGVKYTFSRWSDIQMPSEGRFVVACGGIYGLSDLYGRYQVDPMYTQIELVQPGIYRVHIGDRSGYIRYDGSYIWPLTK